MLLAWVMAKCSGRLWRSAETDILLLGAGRFRVSVGRSLPISLSEAPREVGTGVARRRPEPQDVEPVRVDHDPVRRTRQDAPR